MKKINPETYEKPSKFMKFHEGENRVRVLSDGYLYQKFGLKARGRYVAHIVKDDEPIPELFKGQDPKQTWGWVVWDFKTEDLKILEAGPMLGDQVAKLTKDKLYKQKDILIKKTGEGLNTKYEANFAPDKLSLPEIGKTEAGLYIKYFEGEK